MKLPARWPHPPFILLDEPFAGIDPIAVIEIQRIIGFLKDARHRRADHRPQRARNAGHLRPRLHHQRGHGAHPRHAASHRGQPLKCAGRTWATTSACKPWSGPHRISIRPGIQLQLTLQLQQSFAPAAAVSLELQQEVQQRVLTTPLELKRPRLPPHPLLKSIVSADISSDSEFNTPDNQPKAARSPELEAPQRWEWRPLRLDRDDAPRPCARQRRQRAGPAPRLHRHAPQLASAFARTSQQPAPGPSAERAALEFLIGKPAGQRLPDGDLPELAHTLLPEGATRAETPSAAETRQALMHHLQLALGLLQSMEPAGHGARNVAECLRLQPYPRLGASATGLMPTTPCTNWPW